MINIRSDLNGGINIMQTKQKTSFIELQGKEKKRLIQYLDIKVTMECKNISSPSVEQLLEKVDISKCMNQNYQSIILSRLLLQLQLEYNIPIQNREIYYFYTEGEVFIHCGINPISEDVRIDIKQIDLKTHLHLKVKDLGLSHIERLMLTQNLVSHVEKEKDEPSDSQNQKQPPRGKRQCRRTKERRIGHIIQKVIQWRKYYSGTIDQSRQHQKYSLDEAARKVGISKKSLDDYLFQIRFGYRYGFNFNEYYNQKVGILRDFVRQQKKSTNKVQGKTRKRKTKRQEEGDEEEI